ncbi:HEAT repeat domain-containing protein [candidate division KSB1 bacterium]|nr:HEAT repeat domain-containing protein [candidate division KSB1 bacterium]
MNCKEVKSGLTDYVLKQLDSEFEQDLKKHLQSCLDCKAEFVRLQSAWQRLESIPESKPSPMLWSLFYSMLEKEKQSTVHSTQYTEKETVWDKVDKWLIQWWPRRPAVQFGVSFAVLLIGLWMGGSISSKTIKNGEMLQLRSEVHEMRQFMSLSLMNQSSSVQRIQGVSLTRQVQNPDVSLLDALFETLQSDPNVNVRLAAVDALYLFRDEAHVRDQLIQSLNAQDSPMIQVALIDLITQIREQKALDAIRSLIQKEDLDPEVREYAEQKSLEMS